MSETPLFDALDDAGDRDLSREPGLDPKTLADHLFLDAMLRESFAAPEAAATCRSRGILDGLAHPPAATRPPPTAGRILMTLAAALLLFAGIWFVSVGFRRPDLQALAARIIEDSQRTEDRTYALTVRQWLTGRIAEHEFFTRGPDDCVLRLHLPGGQIATLGRRGQEGWLVPARTSTPVFTAEDSRVLGRVVEGQGLDLLGMTSRDALRKLAEDYDLSEGTPRTDSSLRIVIARRRRRVRELPDELELHVDEATGVVHRLVADWKTRIRRISGRRITLRLLHTRPIEPGFFQHEAHHGPQRTVRRL